jgi:hypothetical protein
MDFVLFCKFWLFNIDFFRFLELETCYFENNSPINSQPIKSVNRPISD